MKCVNCGETVKEGAKQCPNCGEPIKAKLKERQEKEELIKAYIGENYEKIEKKKFSFPAMFLGCFYLLYRRMYAYGILAFFVYLFINFSCVAGFGFLILIQIAISIFLGIKANELYLKEVNKKVDNIIKDNKDKSSAELKSICEDQGGRSFIPPVILALIIALGFGILVLFVNYIAKLDYYGFFDGIYERFYPEEYEEYEEEDEEDLDYDDESDNYDDIIYSNNYLYYELPKEYDIIDFEPDNYAEYERYEDESICSINTEIILNGRMDMDDYRDAQDINLSGIDFKLQTKKQTLREESYSESIYTTEYNNNTYIFTFTNRDETNNVCKEGKDRFFKTLKIQPDKVYIEDEDTEEDSEDVETEIDEEKREYRIPQGNN